MKKYIFLFILFSFTQSIIGQDSKLASEYYRSGEYEKAAELYKKIYDKQRHNPYYFNLYISSLLELDEYDQCISVIKKQLKKQPENVDLYVQYGNVLERQNKFDEADQKYKDAIKNMPAQRSVIHNLGNSFTKFTKYDLAIKTYELGEELLKEPGVFASNLGDIYNRKGDVNKMIANYLLSIKNQPNLIPNRKTFFDRSLTPEGFDELKLQLFDLVQEDPENEHLPELLQWVYIRQKDYTKALRQAKALDNRLGEKGDRIYNIATVAYNDRDYDTALSAFQYIVDKKGPQSSYYLNARKEILGCKRKKMLSNPQYTMEDAKEIEREYILFFEEVGETPDVAFVKLELAKFQAYYLDDLTGAIKNLEGLVTTPSVNKYILGNSKLNLADFYLMDGEIWESTLLYSQVDKEFKEEYFGEIARFKNARLSYFNGDFEWAQSQFDILKSSTSKKISNDAIEMSVFIIDNSGLDTILEPLELYANAELFILQNKYDKAFGELDKIKNTYPGHVLLDDILYAKAQIYVRQKEYELAIDNYNQIIENHAEEIRVDNAIFELAELYDTILEDKTKASELYEKLFVEFSNSTYAIEARKRYRAMRGDFDNVQ